MSVAKYMSKTKKYKDKSKKVSFNSDEESERYNFENLNIGSDSKWDKGHKKQPSQWNMCAKRTVGKE